MEILIKEKGMGHRMKVVILAGGFGTRISEESHLKPKPMIEIGGKPILWHIMKMYAARGFDEFIICGGYKQHVIKEYFANYFLYNSDVTFDFTTGRNDMIVHQDYTENWKVTIVDTGLHTMTGGRIRRIASYLDDGPFCLTYGDGVSDVDLQAVLRQHREKKGLITMTCVQPDTRFGNLNITSDGSVSSFREKQIQDSGWVNGGFMVVEKGILDLIEGDETVFEQHPLEEAARRGQLNAYRHHGFWQCMDTLREKQKLEKMWADGSAPWKVWEK